MKEYPQALPAGSVLAGQYVIEGVLGQGGFGITYVAHDHKSGQKLAIKEYFPDGVVIRENSVHVSCSAGGDRKESFDWGKECFLREATTLADFIGNENIVRVYNYFEENGTAYFAMEYIRGQSLQSYLKDHGNLTFDEACRIFFPVMDALIAVHEKGIVHRDVSPDNIYLTEDDQVKLLDFGAARYSLGDRTKSLSVILKHGYAPLEQYSRHSRQGPYTDVYALAATFYYSLTGTKPPDAVDRVVEDTLVIPSARGADIPEEAEQVLMRALAVKKENRYADMSEFSMDMEKAYSDHWDYSGYGNEEEIYEEENDPEYRDSIEAILERFNEWVEPGIGKKRLKRYGFFLLFLSVVVLAVFFLLVRILSDKGDGDTSGDHRSTAANTPSLITDSGLGAYINDQKTVTSTKAASGTEEKAASIEEKASGAEEEASGTVEKASGVQGTILAMDPPAGEDGSDPKLPEFPAGFYATSIRVGDCEVPAWTNDIFYIFYANSPSGNVGWFLYDSYEARWIRYKESLFADMNWDFCKERADNMEKTETDSDSVMVSIQAMDPPEDPPGIPEGFTETQIRVGSAEVKAWTDDPYYLFYAKSPSGYTGWFLYDSGEGRWVRYLFY